ncbi:hypothetical protein [Streptomyces sp. SID12501]|uniref:Uncharacterized protein n=1 Tax=Streptomyces sp. SID12501 TaxID=2706042 RepID=A0A6B3BNB0_9ACTN|nr:hypothetical protein [Streptomyces sp. SID12501]NEC84393.1 hypothetical protein [Streptomyces sp. SID12501]
MRTIKGCARPTTSTTALNSKVFEVPAGIRLSGIGVRPSEQMLVDMAEATGAELPDR